MIALHDTDALVVALLAAHTTNPVRCVASARDLGGDSLPTTVAANTNGATAVEMVPPPASGIRRLVDFANFYNDDTVNHTLTVSLSKSGALTRLVRVTLGPAERLVFQRSNGFTVYNAAGAYRTIETGTQNAVASGRSMAVLSSSVVNNNATANTIADVTGLSFPVVAGQRYWFRFCIAYTVAATTTGSRWSINGPTTSLLVYGSEYSLTTTSRTMNEGLTAYGLPAAANGSSAATTGNVAIVEGFLTATADGVVIARFASEIASSAITALAGSFVEYMAI